MDEQKIFLLKKWIAESRRIVFFGGAGVSTESGIPDFRGVDGLYHQKFKEPPETIISHSYYVKKPKTFFEFYKTRMLYPDAQPNIAHEKLVQWEKEGKLLAVVTQNIDGLHQLAGSKNVYELHGSVHRNACEECGAFYDLDAFLALGEIPTCRHCGGRVKPDVVLYEDSEALYDKLIENGYEADFVHITGAPHEGNFWSEELLGIIFDFIKKNV